MNGPEHYREAERLLLAAASSSETTFEGENPEADRDIAAAQAHATLAHAAVDVARLADRYVGDGDHINEWRAAVNSTTAPVPQATTPTVYRASRDSIVMGLYDSAAEARKHCESVVRLEHDASTVVQLWWREDEDTVDQPEEGEQELIERVQSSAVPGPGYIHPTGYIVTPLTVASEYDPEADT